MIPVFWEVLFTQWFKDTYVRIKQEWNKEMKTKGVIFNSALGCRGYLFDREFYDWLQAIGAFTFQEVREVWQMFTQKEKSYFMNQIPKKGRDMVLQYFNSDDSDDIDDVETVLFKPTCNIKLIYKVLVAKNSVKPLKAISKWERDLHIGVENYWDFLCTRYSLLYETNLRVFHILFLNRGIFL